MSPQDCASEALRIRPVIASSVARGRPTVYRRRGSAPAKAETPTKASGKEKVEVGVARMRSALRI